MTHKGRTAISRTCELLCLSEKEVLVPSYNSGSEIDPLIKGGARIRPYRVDCSARIDMNDLEERMGKNTKAVYITHYFGYAQAIEDCRKLCDRKGMYLIEDCALALYSCVGERKLGTWGDVAIFSFTKELALPDGGALVINNRAIRGHPWKMRRAPSMAVARALVPVFKATVGYHCARSRLLYGFCCAMNQRLAQCRSARHYCRENGAHGFPDIRKDMYFSEKLMNRRISGVSKRLMRRMNPSWIRAVRRRNYHSLLERLADRSEVTPLYSELPDGVCPLGFPIIVKHRDRVNGELHRRGIASVAFWRGFHRNVDWLCFPEARYLKEHVLLLPVHQMLGEKDMEDIAEATIRAVSGTEAPSFKEWQSEMGMIC